MHGTSAFRAPSSRRASSIIRGIGKYNCLIQQRHDADDSREAKTSPSGEQCSQCNVQKCSRSAPRRIRALGESTMPAMPYRASRVPAGAPRDPAANDNQARRSQLPVPARGASSVGLGRGCQYEQLRVNGPAQSRISHNSRPRSSRSFAIERVRPEISHSLLDDGSA